MEIQEKRIYAENQNLRKNSLNKFKLNKQRPRELWLTTLDMVYVAASGLFGITKIVQELQQLV